VRHNADAETHIAVIAGRRGLDFPSAVLGKYFLKVFKIQIEILQLKSI
jgi:hypothetical protein